MPPKIFFRGDQHFNWHDFQKLINIRFIQIGVEWTPFPPYPRSLPQIIRSGTWLWVCVCVWISAQTHRYRMADWRKQFKSYIKHACNYSIIHNIGACSSRCERISKRLLQYWYSFHSMTCHILTDILEQKKKQNYISTSCNWRRYYHSVALAIFTVLHTHSGTDLLATTENCNFVSWTSQITPRNPLRCVWYWL